MSDLQLGARASIDVGAAGWLYRIATTGNGAQLVIEQAKRDGIEFPEAAVAEALGIMRQAGRIAFASTSADTTLSRGAFASDSAASNPPPTPSKLLSPCDAAGQLGLTPTRVGQLARAGKLGTKVGNAWVFRQEEIDDYAKS